MKSEDKAKLNQIRRKKDVKSKQDKHESEQRRKESQASIEKRLDSVKESIDSLADKLKVEVKLPDVEEVLDQLKSIEGFNERIKLLEKAITDALGKDVIVNNPEEVRIKGFRELWELVVRANNKAQKDAEKLSRGNIKAIEDAMMGLAEMLEDKLADPGQEPDNFTPMRRVVQVGNRLVFDDHVFRGASRGGGSSSGGTQIKDANNQIINPRQEDGHGSSSSDPSYVQEAGPAPLDTANSTQGLLQPGSFTNFTVDAGTDVFTSVAHGLDDGDVIVVTTDDTLPDGMEESQIYYVSDKTDDTFKLKTANNILAGYLDVTDTGTGTHSWAEPAKYEGTWTRLLTATDLFVFAFTAGSAFGGFEVQWSSDGVTQNTDALNISNIKTTENDDTAGFWIYLDTLTTNIDNYYRIVAYAGSDTMTLNDLRTWTYPDGFHGTYIGLNDALSDLSTALLSRSVTAKLQADGDIVNDVAASSDVGNSTTDLLPADEIFLGSWFDTTGFVQGMILVESDQPSSTDGKLIQFTETEPTTLLSADVTVDAGTDVFTSTAHGLVDDDQVYFTSDDTLPAGLRTNQNYYIITATTNTFQVSETEGGSAVNVTDTGTGTHTFTQEPLIHREIVENFDVNGTGRPVFYPVMQGEYYRIKYTNGAIGQNKFVLRTELMPTAAGFPMATLDSNSTPSRLAMTTKSTLALEDEDSGEYSNILQKDGGVKVTTTSHEVDTPIKPFSSWKTSQRNVTSDNAVQLAGTPLTDRKEIQVVNDSSDTKVALGSDSSVTFNTGIRVAAQKDWSAMLNDSAEVWAIADDSVSGGNTTEIAANATDSNSGITNPDNVWASDDSRASIDADADTATYSVANFSFPGSDDTISAVRIGFEGRKESGQTETVTHQETVTNTQSGGTSITSPTIQDGTNQCYVAFIANGRTNPRAVNTVTGLGLTWLEQGEITNSSTDGAVSCWVATGTPTSSGTVTANFATGAIDEGAIVVSRYSGVDQTTPVEDVDTHEASGGGGNTYTSDAITGTASTGRFIAGVNSINRSGTVTTPATSRADISTSSDVNLEVRGGTASASNTVAGTTSGNPDWCLVAITLTPRTADDPEILLEYEISAVAGDTSLTQAISSTTDADYTQDVTDDRVWTDTDLDDIKLVLSGSDISAADAQIDHIYVEVDTAESTNSVRLTVAEFAE